MSVEGGSPNYSNATEGELDRLRKQIIELDDELIRLIGERREVVLEIGRLKRELGLPVMDPAREAQVVRRVAERSRELGVDEELTRDVIWRIISSARDTQNERTISGQSAAPPTNHRPDQ